MVIEKFSMIEFAIFNPKFLDKLEILFSIENENLLANTISSFIIMENIIE